MAGNPLVFRTLISRLAGMEMDIVLTIRGQEQYISTVEVRKSIPRLSRFEESMVAGVLLRTTHLDAIQVPLMVHSLDINERKEKGEDLIPSFFCLVQRN